MPNLGLKNNLMGESTHSAGARSAVDYWVTFDGDADTVDLSSSLNGYFGAKDWSLSAWIYHGGSSGTIFSTGHISSGYAFRWSLTGDKLKYYFGNSTTNIQGQTTSPLTDNTWYQVGITHDSSEETVKFYTNGSVTNTFTSAVVPGTVHDTNANIGALAESSSSSEFTGRIANVAVFSDLVTAAEMLNLASVNTYDATSIGNCVGWWRMGAGTEAGEGSTIYDMSTNSNNGTLAGDAAIASGSI